MSSIATVAKQVYATNNEVKNAGKSLSVSLRKMPTGKALEAEIKKAKKRYEAELNAVNKIQTAIKKNQKTIDKANDYLAKTNGYNAAKDTLTAAEKKVTALEKKIAATKDKTTKKKLTEQLKTAKKTVKTVEADLEKIKKSTTAQKEFSALKKAKAHNTAYAKTLKAAKKKLATRKKQYQGILKVRKQEKAAALKALQKKNQASINAKIKAQTGKMLKPQTAIWRADLKTDSVCFLGEVSPTESNDADGPTNAIDNADPRTNYLRRSSKTLSGTYYLMTTGGTDRLSRWANLDKHFDSLQKWQLWGLELCVRGFSKWKHVYMTNISKVSENKDRTGLQLNITFNYKKTATLVYRKKKSKTNGKGTTTRKSGTSSKSKTAKTKGHTLKAGDTLWGLAKKYGTTVSALRKANPKVSKTMAVGQKLVIK